MLVPLYGFVQGDTMGLLVLAHDTMRLEEVKNKLRASASVRVDTSVDDHWQLQSEGQPLDGAKTVAEAGLPSLARVDLRRRPP